MWKRNSDPRITETNQTKPQEEPCVLADVFAELSMASGHFTSMKVM